MKDVRQDVKQILEKVENIKEVELFVQISASLKGDINFDTKGHRKRRSIQRASYKSFLFFLFFER